jgi:putative two-component system response regulator
MKIVVVDDSVTNLVVLKCLSAGVNAAEVSAFTDSVVACKHLADHHADVIVVDYSMPKMNGIEFIHAVRQHAHHARTPILMVTGQGDRDTRIKALEAGATDFLNKPLDAAEFKARLRNLTPIDSAPRTGTHG